MSEHDKERIEKEAREFILKNLFADPETITTVSTEGCYIAGATAEHERMADELNTEKHLVNVYKIQAKAAQGRLDQERNKAIDEVIELIPVALDSNMTLSEIIKALEYLKSS